jgi:hypothetical protein
MRLAEQPLIGAGRAERLPAERRLDRIDLKARDARFGGRSAPSRQVAQAPGAFG